jgi:hypothetical protein
MGRSYRADVRVSFPDGSPPVEFMQKNLDRYKHGWKLKGDVVPVRYDASDHSKIAVDVSALENERHAESAEAGTSGDALVARAEQELAGNDTPEPRTDPS